MGYRIGEYELDTRRELLLGPSGPVPLRRLIYRLLLLLARKAPGVVSHDELLDTLWGPEALSPNVLPQTISELRRALGDDPRRPRLIATRHRRGYALIAPVRATDDVPLEAGRMRQLGAGAVLVRTGRLPPAVQCALQAVAASAASWAIRWPGEQLALGETAWVLELAGRRWQFTSPDGATQRSGTLRQTAALAQVGELLEVVGTCSGRGPLGWPDGWAPAAASRVTGDTAALCSACAAAAAGEAGQALQHFASLDAAHSCDSLQGWPRLWHALALSGAGRRAEARQRLAGMGASTDPMLTLRTEALACRLEGRRDEALAALRAAAMLAPDDLLLALAVLDEQIDQGHWAAAASQLERLRPRVQPAAWAWREAALTAATRPDQALACFEAAERTAGDTPELRTRWRALRVCWHLDRGEVAAAAAALAAAQPLDGPLLTLQARCLLDQGDVGRAREQFELAAQTHQQGGWVGLARHARLGAVEAQFRSGDAQGALVGLEALRVEAAPDADGAPEIERLILAGRCHAALHHSAEAERLLELATTAARRQGYACLAATARHHLGSALALQRRQPERAEACFRLAAEGFRDAGDALGEVRAQSNLALMAERAGRRLEARQAYQDALRLLQPLQARQEHGRVAYNTGVNERDLGDLAAAAAAFDQALDQLQAVPGSDLRTMAVAARADLALQMGDTGVARALLDAAATAAAASGPLPRSCWHTANARWHDLAGNVPAAEAELDTAEALRRATGVRASMIDLSLRRLSLRLAPGAPACEALLVLERLEAELLRLGEAKYALTAGLLTATACHEAGEPGKAADKAAALWQQAQRDGTRQQQLLADWVLALSAPGSERERRLRALAHDAAECGFALIAAACTHRAALACGQTRTPLPGAIAGVLRNVAAIF
jgi:DNA-binding winged helix-turn-helix (wHTH) protein